MTLGGRAASGHAPRAAMDRITISLDHLYVRKAPACRRIDGEARRRLVARTPLFGLLER
jgi:hypothetical protein